MNYGLSPLQRAKWTTKKWYRQLLRKIKSSPLVTWDNYIKDTYILHLEDRTDRYKELNKELNKIKTTTGTLADNVTWFPAHKDIISYPKSWHIDEYSFDYHWVIDPDPWFYDSLDDLENQMIQCSPAETAISIGHLKMWKAFLESGAETAMFLEDDIFFDYQFETRINSIFQNELPKDWDLLYLGAMPCHHGFTWDPHSENLIRLYNGVWWMSSYILTRKAAQKLVDNIPIVGPVDVWINYQFEDMKVFMTIGNLIEQTGVEDSDNTYSFVEEFY